MSDFFKRLAAQRTAVLEHGPAPVIAKPANQTKVSPLAAAIARSKAEREAAESLSSPTLDSESASAAASAEGAASVALVADAAPPINEQMKQANQRKLWYHPESDSLFETIGTVDDSDIAFCDDVTDMVDYEERFAEQKAIEDRDVEREILEGEILPPSRELSVIEEERDLTLSTQVDNDHARRAVARAMAVFNIMEGVNITPDPSQVNAVHTLAKVQYGCLIGAAGTGKTTTTRMLLHILMNGDAAAGIEPMRISDVDMKNYHKAEVPEDSDEAAEYMEEQMERAMHSRIPSIALCAYTGQATQVLRKNMPGPWKANCFTIHSLLAFKPAEYEKPNGDKGWRFEPTYTKWLRMPWDVIVVDEASMVNLELWHMLLDACKPGCRIYFIGDLNQLPPPIGMGILGFALAKWPVCELTVVHRQSDEAANKIIDTAHAILNGKFDAVMKMDDPKTNPNWRVIGYEIDHQVHKAHDQVLAIANALTKQRVKPVVDPAEPQIYDPWRDRIMVPMNGFNPEDPGHLLGQGPLNDALSRIFQDPDEPRIIIDAQRSIKKFAVGYRVMATKNEPPNELNRVTNGLTGKIVGIRPNQDWFGDKRLVGEEQEVMANRRAMVIGGVESSGPAIFSRAEEEDEDSLSELAEGISANTKEEKISGPASHIVSVKYDSGAFREYNLNAEVDQLQIAYASTVHKAQGAEMPTAIIIVHHANKFMLCRENFYTAVTRARERVIILYTQLGLRIALSKQKISGANLADKIRSYQKMMGGEDGTGFKTVNVKLTEDDL